MNDQATAFLPHITSYCGSYLRHSSSERERERPIAAQTDWREKEVQQLLSTASPFTVVTPRRAEGRRSCCAQASSAVRSEHHCDGS
mmetsp:Transcript_10399/g.17891  ORF Transcript_10399/g.17891 Transcript_10399/m.17891 type:complete len:86 (-) Transcript_10399:32-289(-)